jgi:hypothetical protein
MRLSGQYGARWHDVDIEHRTVTVPRDKSGRTSHVCLNDAAGFLAGARVAEWAYAGDLKSRQGISQRGARKRGSAKTTDFTACSSLATAH